MATKTPPKTVKKTLEHILDAKPLPEQEMNREDEQIHRYRQAIRNFCTLTRAAVISGGTVLKELYTPYEMMMPALHKNCTNSEVVDLTAFSYALQRMPEEISGIKEIYIKSSPEDLSAVPGIKVLKCIKHEARRRTMYSIREDYIQMIARESDTDILDIITSLIMYAKEAEKIKKKLAGHTITEKLSEFTHIKQSDEKNKLLVELSDKFHVNYEKLRQVDENLDHKLFSIISNLMGQNPANIKVEFDDEFARTDDPKKARKWCRNIIDEVQKYNHRPIILISSDTHSVVNCLTGFAIENKDEILEMAKKDPDLKDIRVEDEKGLYFLVQKLSKKNPAFLERKCQYEQNLGISFIKDRFNTGIDIQIIDTARLDYSKIDPHIHVSSELRTRKAPIILNIDYAFGKEGKDIMDELCEAFGDRIESISITGKAGILCGKKYDIMLPDFVVPQLEGGGVYQFPNRTNSLRKNQFRGIFPLAKVHHRGSMLTVPGTAIQNEMVMKDYLERYHVLGLEMEAAPYFDSIEKAYARGILRKDIMMNVGYWGSDNPLNESESLAEPHRAKGFGPTYSMIVAVLNNVLNYKRNQDKEANKIKKQLE